MLSNKWKTKLFTGILIFSITGCGMGKSLYDSGKAGYTPVTTMGGATFEINSAVARNATAITNISPDMNFEPDQTYLYKNGEDEYFLFNMSSVVLVAQKGTKFDLSLSNKAETVKSAGILGVWFTPEKKNGLEYSEMTDSNGIYKMVATVTGQVSINENLYNDFTGKLSIIDDGSTQWAMFVGSIGDDYSKLDNATQDVLSYMAYTLDVEQNSPIQSVGEQVYVVSNDQTLGSEEMEEVPEQISQIETESQDTVPSDIVIIEEEQSMNTEAGIQDETGVQIGHPETVIQEEQSSEEIQSTEETVISLEPEYPVIVNGRETIRLNNQKHKEKKPNTVYESSIYDLLEPGQAGYASVIVGKKYEKVTVTLDKIYRDKEAQSMLIKFYANGIAQGNYFEASPGTSWQVAHFKINYGDAEGYLNSKFCGMDGAALNYRGIKYSQKTYNCHEYVLSFGEGNPEAATSGIVSAYYRIVEK